MADVEIKGRITVDTGNASKSTNDYIDALKAAKKAVNEAKQGSVEYKKAQEDLAKATKDLDNSVAKSGGSFGKLKDTLGGVVPGFQGASDGASGFGKQLMVLAVNPIVLILTAIVAACMLVYKAFASTNEGADKIDQVLSGLGATVEVLRDRVLAVAGALGKFFSGDFKGAMEQGKAAVSGIGQEIADEFAAAAQATKTLQDLEDSMRAISVGRAELNRDLAKAKELMSDSDASSADRRAAINKVRAAEGLQNAKELEQARKNYDAIVQQNRLSEGVSDENLDREAAAKVSLINLETQSAQNIRSLNKLEKSLNKEIEAKADQEAKERADKRKIAKDKALKAEQDGFKKIASDYKAGQDELAAIENTGLDMLKVADAEKARLQQNEMDRGSSKMQQIRADHEEEKRIKQAALDFKLSVLAQELDAAQQFGALLQQVAGKSKAMAIAGLVIERAAGIGKIFMNGFLANAKSMAAFPLTLGQPFVGIQNVMTGMQIAGTIASGAKAISAMGGGSGGSVSAPSMPSVSAPSPLTPQPQRTSTTLDSNSIQGIGNAANGGVSRSFVLESDITNNRERTERINRAARLG